MRDADLRLAPAQELPFADDSFDAIVSHMALMLMSDIEQVIAEAARVLKPGGRFAVSVGVGPVGPDLFLSLAQPVFAALPPQRRVPSMGDRRTRSREGLDKLLTPAGFMSVSWEEMALELTGTPEQVWEAAIPSYYHMVALDAGQLERLREKFIAQATASSSAGQLHGGARIAVATTQLGPPRHPISAASTTFVTGKSLQPPDTESGLATPFRGVDLCRGGGRRGSGRRWRCRDCRAVGRSSALG